MQVVPMVTRQEVNNTNVTPSLKIILHKEMQGRLAGMFNLVSPAIPDYECGEWRERAPWQYVSDVDVMKSICLSSAQMIIRPENYKQKPPEYILHH